MAAMPWKKRSVDQQRERLALKMIRGGVGVTALSARFGVSRQTAYVWLRRYKLWGRSGLVSRHGGRPRGRSAASDKWLRRLLVVRRQRPSWGADKLRWLLGRAYPNEPIPVARTLHRWLVRAGRVKPRRRRLRAGYGLSHAVSAVASNDVWTTDFKGDIYTRDGRRMLPLTVRDLASRYVLAVRPVAQTSVATIRRIFQRLFRRYGVPRAIRVDQGTPFCGSGPYGLTMLSLWWTRLGIEVQVVSRRHGINNNAHEQMHRMLKAEAASPVSKTYAAQVRRLQRWRYNYNHRRPNQSLGGEPPATVYQPGTRQKRRLLIPTYPAHWTIRRVRSHGWVKLAGSHRHIGRTFTGLSVGFLIKPHSCHVYFGSLLLGTLDLGNPRAGLNPVRQFKVREGAAAPSLKPSPAL